MKKLTLEDTFFLVKSSCKDNCHLLTNNWMVILTKENFGEFLSDLAKTSCQIVLFSSKTATESLSPYTVFVLIFIFVDFW